MPKYLTAEQFDFKYRGNGLPDYLIWIIPLARAMNIDSQLSPGNPVITILDEIVDNDYTICLDPTFCYNAVRFTSKDDYNLVRLLYGV